VVNESVVLPARFFGRRKTGASLEGLFLEAKEDRVRVWLKGKVNLDEIILIDGFGDVKVISRSEKEAELFCDPASFIHFLKSHGELPIPPYIRNERQARGLKSQLPVDRESYQTVFAKQSDKKIVDDYSVASPTASLHFDAELLSALKTKGIQVESISLSVGEGTFAPVMVEDLRNHKMHEEQCSVRPEVWAKIQKTKASGGRVIAVGTTAMRTLESAARRDAENLIDFETSLYICPPFEFKVVDGLITNFHWPDSTLIVLVATFLESQGGLCKSVLHHRWRTYYDIAIRERYRLFSYGDGMLIL
jgi:S-adenosylmethionine:tRNA ribosyltransferase-isomerase